MTGIGGGWQDDGSGGGAGDITGVGTVNYYAKFTAAKVIGNGFISDNGVDTVSVGANLNVIGKLTVTGIIDPTQIQFSGVGTPDVTKYEVGFKTASLYFNSPTGGDMDWRINGVSKMNLSTTGILSGVTIEENLADGKIKIGNVSNVAQPVTPSGDWTITNAGVSTVNWSNGYTTYDARYLKLGGGTMTGNLILNSDATLSLQAVTYQQLQAWQTGLWDDRGNFTPSGSYPNSGGSGPAGAILKGDIWTISGLGAGVPGTMGAKTVYDGDTVRALIDTPGNTDANWAEQEGALGYTPLSNVLNSGRIFVGNVSNVATGVDMTGDVTISNTGVTAIGAGKVTYSMLASMTSAQFAGVISNPTGYAIGALLVFNDTPLFKSEIDINNPANTFKYRIIPSAIVADRILNLPLLTGTDTIAVLDLLQTFTNKTLTNCAANTQSANDNSTKIATTAYVDAATSTAAWIYSLKITTGNQSTTSNLAGNITGLVYAVASNSVYTIQGAFKISCNNTGGVKFTVTTPAGTTQWINIMGSTTSNVTFASSSIVTSGTLTGTAFCAEAQSREVIINGTVTTGVTSGNLQFQFASGTDTQTSTIFQEGTYLRIQKTA